MGAAKSNETREHLYSGVWPMPVDKVKTTQTVNNKMARYESYSPSYASMT